MARDYNLQMEREKAERDEEIFQEHQARNSARSTLSGFSRYPVIKTTYCIHGSLQIASNLRSRKEEIHEAC